MTVVARLSDLPARAEARCVLCQFTTEPGPSFGVVVNLATHLALAHGLWAGGTP